MKEYKVVITKNGFMCTKAVGTILDTDEVLFTGTPTTCNNFIHSIKPPRNQNIFK